MTIFRVVKVGKVWAVFWIFGGRNFVRFFGVMFCSLSVRDCGVRLFCESALGTGICAVRLGFFILALRFLFLDLVR